MTFTKSSKLQPWPDMLNCQFSEISDDLFWAHARRQILQNVVNDTRVPTKHGLPLRTPARVSISLVGSNPTTLPLSIRLSSEGT